MLSAVVKSASNLQPGRDGGVRGPIFCKDLKHDAESPFGCNDGLSAWLFSLLQTLVCRHRVRLSPNVHHSRYTGCCHNYTNR